MITLYSSSVLQFQFSLYLKANSPGQEHFYKYTVCLDFYLTRRPFDCITRVGRIRL
jgi:hypothetical protein